MQVAGVSVIRVKEILTLCLPPQGEQSNLLTEVVVIFSSVTKASNVL